MNLTEPLLPPRLEKPSKVADRMAFGDTADDVQEDQEHEFVISPERLEWLQELQRRVGEAARDVPRKTKATRRRADPRRHRRADRTTGRVTERPDAAADARQVPTAARPRHLSSDPCLVRWRQLRGSGAPGRR